MQTALKLLRAQLEKFRNTSHVNSIYFTFTDIHTSKQTAEEVSFNGEVFDIYLFIDKNYTANLEVNIASYAVAINALTIKWSKINRR